MISETVQIIYASIMGLSLGLMAYKSFVEAKKLGSIEQRMDDIESVLSDRTKFRKAITKLTKKKR